MCATQMTLAAMTRRLSPLRLVAWFGGWLAGWGWMGVWVATCYNPFSCDYASRVYLVSSFQDFVMPHHILLHRCCGCKARCVKISYAGHLQIPHSCDTVKVENKLQ